MQFNEHNVSQCSYELSNSKHWLLCCTTSDVQERYKRGTGPTDNIYFVTSYFITHYDIVLTALSSTIYSDIQLVNRLFKLQCKYYYHVVSPF